MEDEDRDRRERPERQSEKKSPFVINIPSYQEVIDSSLPKPTSSFFNPSPSFSQSFNFIKNSEFYTPPPPPPPPASESSRPSGSSEAADTRRNGQSGVAAAPSSSSAQTTQSRNAILVSHRQKGNPLLKHIRNVKWAFADIICDYLLGQSTCALYLSLRYHLLYPDYLYYRIRELQKNFKLRVVLCHVDVEDVVKPLLEVTKTAMLHDCSLLCAWSLEECGRYLETIKVYENKPADIIQGQMDSDYLSRLSHSLTSIRHINKTDVVTLGSTFGSLAHIMDASMEDLARCPGIGERKVKRLYDTFHEPFKREVPLRPSVPETSSAQNNFEVQHSVSDEGKEDKKEDGSKRAKTKPEVTIKSALSAALAKYGDKVGKKKKQEEDTTVVAVEPSAGNSSKEAAAI